jgi:murein L,D-transpeptidase YcbB/YkuD
LSRKAASAAGRRKREREQKVRRNKAAIIFASNWLRAVALRVPYAMRNPFSTALAAFLLLASPATAQSMDNANNRQDAVSAVDQAIAADPVSDAIRGLLTEGQWKPSLVKLDWDTLRNFYRRRDDAAAWTDDGTVEAVRDALANADREGLRASDYGIDSIQPPDDGDPGRWARYDILLTNSVLRYAHDARLGRVKPGAVYDDVDFGARGFDAPAELQSALSNQTLDSFLNSLPPPQPGYAALRKLLAAYRDIASDGGWQSLPDTRTITNRPRDPLFSQLRDRMQAEDAVLKEGGTAPATVHEAVAVFQREHGLTPSGVADRKTIDELNVGVDARIAEIEANMERWRWQPRAADPRYVVVNVPSETLTVFDSGRSILTSRVVVGRESDPTPLLYTEAQALTVNPVWNIPADIMKKEILPKARAHPGYLKREHIEVVDRASLHYKQLPGPRNALGSLRIDIPNRFNIYLHDTPGRSLFARNERDESHGCIRVEQILPLASVALTGDPDAAVPDLRATIASGQTRQYDLDNTLPVYVVYRTMTVDENGAVRFWPDIYGRDDQLTTALKNRNVGMRISVL